MSPDEFGACVELLGGMTSAARYLDISTSCVQSYRAGRTKIPARIAEKAQALVADGPKKKLVRERLAFNRAKPTNKRRSSAA